MSTHPHPVVPFTQDRLCEVLGVPFTDEQLAAITAPLSPGLIVAGAGSGKTTVMAARVVWLVGTGAVQPEQVLGLTFTNKAAAELAHKVSDSLTKAGFGAAARSQTSSPGDPSAASAPVASASHGHEQDAPTDDGPGEPVISTYHSFAGRLVKEHGLRLGVEPRARLLADATRFQLAARVLRRHRGPIVSLTRPMSMLVGELVALESELSEHLVDPAGLQEWDQAWIDEVQRTCDGLDGTRGLKTHCDTLRKYAGAARQRLELATLVADYRAAKAELDAVDFGDQVALAARLCETVPEVGEVERDTARVVLLDEYQDTSVAQRRMLAGIFGGGHPVTAVGDPCQAIYGWRGASVSNLDGFPEHFPQATGAPSSTFSLSVNQRSGGRLLQLANAVAETLRQRHTVVRLRAPEAKAEHGRVRVALHPTWRDEVEWAADQVVAARSRRFGAVTDGSGETEWRQIAVLVRARKDFGDLHAALVARNVPVEVVGLGGLLQLPEVADVLAVLELVDDPTANAALVRLLTGPRFRLGVRDLARLGRRGRDLLRTQVPDTTPPDEAAAEAGPRDEVDSALEDAVAGVDPCDVVALSDVLDRPGHEGWSPEGLQRVTALGSELRALRLARDEPLLDLVHRVISVTGLDVELAASPEAVAARRRETLSAFLDVVADFVDLDGESSLTSFLAYLRAADDYERGLDAVAPSGADAVQLLTAHRAKGLEWDVVICPDLTKGVFPADTMRGRWTTTAAVLPGPLRGDALDQPSLDRALDKAAVSSYDGECRSYLEREERRLGYVAFTRARHLLVVSGHWWGPTQKKPRGPSAFLDEVRQHAEDGWGEVDVWTEEPADDDGNPLLLEHVQHEWPAPYAPEPLQRRQTAAARVRAGLEDPAPLAARLALGAAAGVGPDGLTAAEAHELARLDRETELLLEEERRARVPQRDVRLPTSLSASQLVRLQADEGAFARELARPMPRRPAPAARRGTRFHAWVEGLFGARPLLDPDELPGAEDDELGTDADLAALKKAFLDSPWSQVPPAHIEAPFALPLAGRVVRGRIDAVYDLGPDHPLGRWKVVDWKTGRERSDPLQLAVYRLAWARLQGIDPAQVAASFLYVRDGREELHHDLPGTVELERLLGGGPAHGDSRAAGGEALVEGGQEP